MQVDLNPDFYKLQKDENEAGDDDGNFRVKFSAQNVLIKVVMAMAISQYNVAFNSKLCIQKT